MVLKELYNKYKTTLQDEGYTVEDMKEINYGIQFKISKSDKDETIRIYNGRKGIKLDLSMVKDRIIKYSLYGLLTGEVPNEATGKKYSALSNDITNSMIGTDESGKGDYYGPLVIASVYTNEELYLKLQDLGVMDSKRLSDDRITELAKDIKELCPYKILALDNILYNKIYEKCPNLNHLLAVCHMDVIHELLQDSRCIDTNVALIDQFAKGELLDDMAKEAGIVDTIAVEYKTNGESNIAVAAASILARAEFVKMCKDMIDTYKIQFPKGCYLGIRETRAAFIKKYGEDRLPEVCKAHFKLPKS